MSDELIGGMIKGAVMAISLSLIGLLLFYVLNIIKKVLFKAKKTVTPLSKAVYNHSKDIANEIKPAINEYKEKHSTTKDENQITETINSEITEDEIYEKIMIEIEEDKKVKSTWAKSLAQSDGDDKKANSLYINLRVQEIKIELENLQKQRALEIQLQKQIEKEEQKANEIKKATATIYNLEEIENYGYSFISKNTVRKNGSWDDFDLVYDETLDIYFIKNNVEIVAAFYLKG